MTEDLFGALRPKREEIREGVFLFPSYCETRELISLVNKMTGLAPFRHMKTPGGKRMSVAISNCGSVGWVSDNMGYRYSPTDPLSGKRWPKIPLLFSQLARGASEEAGFQGFEADCCLVNNYSEASRLSPHQDKDENNFAWPIVSVSIGVSAIFDLYGNRRGGRATKIQLDDGDVLVFGGPARLAFHGVSKLLAQGASILGGQRINLTFRRALS